MTAPAVRVRFAPAPTGALHVGGARTALFNYLFARHHRGAVVLRSEDTDLARSSVESESAIQSDLRWLGLDWDEGTDVGGPYAPYRQTERHERYAVAAARLLEIEAAYPCYCSAEELAAEREQAEARKLAPKYSGKCRLLTRAERSQLEREGRKPTLRFAMPQRDIYVEDLVRGSVHFPPDAIGDFVILKSDKTPTYNFAAVIDDSDMLISHVLRGDEHLPNTPRQVAVYEALELPLPLFAHVSMILAPDHHKLSKRHGATSVAEYREAGFLPEALVNYLALLGWSPGDDREFFTLHQLVELFFLERVSKSPAVFDLAKLRWFNAQYLRARSPDERTKLFADWARSDGRLETLPELSDATWRLAMTDALSDHVELLSDVPRELDALLSDPPLDERVTDALNDERVRQMLTDIARSAESAADAAAFEHAISKQSLQELGDRYGVKGRALFRPIRLAVTGSEHGIELPLLLRLLGPKRVARRIAAALAAGAHARQEQLRSG
ncbi:MAG: glutamate--tRNA ligase [Candidatus Eremiobacter antarcticus]|nr:glutamate--tRNA ligase [Candidatus Eremiobacteraeota bacterium]MBC5808651.1 glutamate--tRNA ligase [Candidatus Eremiobacteraeota bacterium]PZR62236.1 MAG: glutamate--tRNA ligase [Candidatus Eremiobacter sp. RRmetagenome_bin22]